MSKWATYYHYITNNKLLFSGFAIIGICLSHIIRVDTSTHFWAIFYPGFSGVDVFLFFSGYGLSHSFQKNSLKTFYIHRFKRIYPLLVLFTVFIYSIWFFTNHKTFSGFDIFCNLTTLNFWGVGGVLVEWYLSFIIYLYIAFPLLFMIVRKGGISVIIASLACLFLFLYFYREGWLYQCAFSRIPVFLLGILCYFQNEFEIFKKGGLAFFIALLLMMIFYAFHIVQKFEIVYMAAPFIMFVIAMISYRTIGTSGIAFKTISFFGNYSLEIYLTNMLVLFVMPILDFSIPVAVTYFGAHLLIAPVFILVNHFFRN